MKKTKFGAIFFGDSPAIRNLSLGIAFFAVLMIGGNWLGLHHEVQMERQNEINGAYKDTANFARAFEEHTERTLKSADQALLFLKYQYEHEGRAIDIPRCIKDGRLVIQPFFMLGVIDENGDLVASSRAPFAPANLKDREHFLVHKDVDNGQLFISKPVIGRSSGRLSIQITRRINKPDGSFGGVAVVAIDPLYFSEFYKQVDLGKHSVIALVGRDGVLRVRQAGQEVQVGRDYSSYVVMKKVSTSETGHFTTESAVDGIRRIYSYQALRDYPLVVVVGLDEREVFREMNERVADYNLIAWGVSAGIVIFTLMLLGAVFRLKRTEDALKQARDGLEVNVEQRTGELFGANQELSAMNQEHVAMNEELQHANNELLHEISDRKRIEKILKTSTKELTKKNSELRAALATIDQTQARMIQQEKLAGIGQLAAGVAHEINNPLGYVTNNVETLEQYFAAFAAVLAEYRQLRTCIAATDPQIQAKIGRIIKLETEQDLDYIIGDLPELFRDTTDGLNRMSKIVKGMRLFSRVDRQQVFELYDLNKGLENTLLVANNEIKHSAVIEEHFGQIPPLEAIGGEINQVLLNLIINAAQAVRECDNEMTGVIRIATWQEGEAVCCSVEDSGGGIPKEHLKNIFNPFFTTKPVGQGTGMGLSISYDIIVNRHHGEIMVESPKGKGAKFTVKLPVKHDFTKDNPS